MCASVGSFGEGSFCDIHHTVSIPHERYTEPCSHQLVLNFYLVVWIQRHQEVAQYIHEHKFFFSKSNETAGALSD